MKKAILLTYLLWASLASAQTVHTVPNKDGNNVFTGTDQFLLGTIEGPKTFATLPVSPLDGTLIYCSDCVVQDPCVGAGPGAFAMRVAGAWDCATHGAGGGSGAVNAGTNNTIAKYVSGTNIGNSGVTDNGTTVSTAENISANQLTSTVATGTAPLVVASTTAVANLNASQLLGATWASPAAIGTGTPAAGTFTNLTATGTLTGIGTVTHTPGALPSGNFILGNGTGDVKDSTFSIVPVVNGGSGTATPRLVAGLDISVTGSWPNQTIAVTDAPTLLGFTWAIPGIIGQTSPNSATFTNLTITGTCTGCPSGGGGAVSSVFGRTGVVVATTGDYTAAQVTNAVSLAPTAIQTIQGTTSGVINLNAKCPAGAAASLACIEATDNAGNLLFQVEQNGTTQFGAGVGGQITLTDIVGPNALPATAGQVRVSTTDSGLCWRSNDNSTNFCLAKTAADVLTSDIAVAIKETVAGSGIANYGVLYEDSTTHVPSWSANNGSFLVIPRETGAMTSGHLVGVNATTNLIADSGVVAANVLTGTATNHGVAVGGAAQALSFTAAGTSGQCLLSNGAAADPTYQTCPSAATSTLSGITAAVAGNTISSGDFAQVWQWQGTTSGRVAFKIGENAASTSAGTPVLFQVSTLATSTMNPVQFDSNGNGLRMDTTGKFAKIGTGSLDVNSLSSVTGSGAAVLATSATSVTLDAEGTSNVLTRPFYVEFTPSCNNATATPGAFDLPTTSAPTVTCFGTTTTQGALDFVHGSTTTATGHFTLPQGWTGNMDVRLSWFANSSSANAVRLSVQTGCVADAGAVNTGPSYNAASASNTAYTGTANQRKTTLLSAVAMTNCAAGNEMYFQVQRIGADAGDTLTATAEALSVQFEGRTTK